MASENSSLPQNLGPLKSRVRLATEGYAAFISFCFVMGALSWLNGDPQSLVALKVIFAPFFLLANRAIPAFFKEPIIEPRFTARAIECHLLMAAVFAGFMTVLGWNPDKPVGQIIQTLLIGFVIMGITQTVILWMRVRRAQSQTSSI